MDENNEIKEKKRRAEERRKREKDEKARRIFAIVCGFISMFIFGIIAGMFIEMVLDEDSTGQKNGAVTQQATYIEITANELLSAFNKNEVAAEEKYTGKNVRVTGVISDINSADSWSSANVLFETDGLLHDVQCNFDSNNAPALTYLKIGQTVTIEGVCGKIQTFNLIIKSCKVIKTVTEVQTSVETTQTPCIEITASELWNEFDKNEVAAEQTYTGKTVRITGVVNNINSSSTLISANVLLECGTYYRSIQCNFYAENEASLANLSIGQTVTIEGICGKIAITNIMVESCKIVE